MGARPGARRGRPGWPAGCPRRSAAGASRGRGNRCGSGGSGLGGWSYAVSLVWPIRSYHRKVASSARREVDLPAHRHAGQTRVMSRGGSHDFDFQTGRWRVRNERLVTRLQGCTEWETFEAAVSARLLPGGLGNTDEYLTDHWPGFAGMSLRIYSRETGQWSIYWASNRTGALEPPVVGSFAGGVGV